MFDFSSAKWIRLRNRMKAQKSRDKKKAYLTALEGKLDELGKVNSDLEERCNALQIENELMKNVSALVFYYSRMT